MSQTPLFRRVLPLVTLTVSPPGGGAAEVLVRLSPRERSIGRLLIMGYNAKTIAGQLRLKPNTVEKYIQAMAHRLYLTGRMDLMIWLLQRPQVLTGVPSPSKLHAPGCACNAIYCSALRAACVDVPQPSEVPQPPVDVPQAA